MGKEKQIIRIDSQMINAFQACETKFRYSFVEHLKSKETKISLGKGGFVHKLLGMYYTLRMEGLLPWSDIVEKVKSTISVFALKTSLDAEWCEEIGWRFEEYATYYKNETWQIHAVETPFSVILYEDDNITIILEGKPDMISSLIDYPDKKFPVDHKSFSRFYKSVSLDNQFMGYCWSVGSTMLVKNKFGLQKTLPIKERYVREIVNYSRTRLAEWRVETIKTVFRMIKAMKDDDYPRRLPSCSSFGGCTFVEVCSEEAHMRDQLITRDFIKEVWDVSKGLGENKGDKKNGRINVGVQRLP